MAGTVFYARVSKKDSHGISGSISAQFGLMENMWKMICPEDNEVLYLSDDGYSGRDAKRPAFRRLLGLIVLGEVNVLIVKDFSRLCRDYILFGLLSREIFVRYNVRFMSVAENYDSFLSGNGTFGMDVRSVFNEYYCHDISRKVKMALNSKKENGDYFCVRPPFGYRWSDDKRCWEVVHAEALVVRYIFRQYASGKSLKSIGTEVAKRYSTRKSNWEPAAVWQILHNPVYKGCMVLHKYETDNNTYGMVHAIPRGEWELRDGRHEAIVGSDEWERAVLRGERSKVNASRKGRRHIFHGLTKCMVCGRALSCGRRDKQMLCCNHCGVHEEKRIGTGRLFEVCLSEFNKECLRCGIGEIEIVDRESFLNNFIKRIDVGADGNIIIFWNFTQNIS